MQGKVACMLFAITNFLGEDASNPIYNLACMARY